jgi:hypothetical protein
MPTYYERRVIDTPELKNLIPLGIEFLNRHEEVYLSKLISRFKESDQLDLLTHMVPRFYPERRRELLAELAEMADKMKLRTLIESKYLHVSNSGVTFSVVDNGYGPCLEIRASAFGNLQTTLTVITRKQELKALGEMLIRASEFKGYSEEYCNAAKIPEE